MEINGGFVPLAHPIIGNEADVLTKVMSAGFLGWKVTVNLLTCRQPLQRAPRPPPLSSHRMKAFKSD